MPPPPANVPGRQYRVRQRVRNYPELGDGLAELRTALGAGEHLVETALYGDADAAGRLADVGSVPLDLAVVGGSMTDTSDRVIDELVHRGETLTLRDVVSIVERHHPDERPGADRETVEAYVDGLAARRDFRLDESEFLAELDERLTDSETWAGADRVYELDAGRLSTYPKSWHERLGGTTDPREYVEFLQTEVPEFKRDVGEGGAGPGVPQQPLLDVVAAVGGIDRDEARARLEELRKQGVLAEDADQHPNAGVVLADEHGEYRNSAVEE